VQVTRSNTSCCCPLTVALQVEATTFSRATIWLDAAGILKRLHMTYCCSLHRCNNCSFPPCVAAHLYAGAEDIIKSVKQEELATLPSCVRLEHCRTARACTPPAARPPYLEASRCVRGIRFALTSHALAGHHCAGKASVMGW
jgi:hypothetical protein